MLVALDKNGNRIYANDGVRYEEYFCQRCGEKLIHKKGKYRAPYFSHLPKTMCDYDKDSKSPWHIHMQELFPKESWERRFIDEEKNELHIADVFLEDSNTVIEFQHSKIDENEFLERTMFHILNGRRIVWIFDEFNEEKASCRLKKEESLFGIEYQWLWSPRKELGSFGYDIDETINWLDYSVCVYMGDKEDAVYRIVDLTKDCKHVKLSRKPIVLNKNMNVDTLFQPENETAVSKRIFAEHTKNCLNNIIKNLTSVENQNQVDIPLSHIPVVQNQRRKLEQRYSSNSFQSNNNGRSTFRKKRR